MKETRCFTESQIQSGLLEWQILDVAQHTSITPTYWKTTLPNANAWKVDSIKCQPMKSRLYQMPTHWKTTLPNANPWKVDSTKGQPTERRLYQMSTQEKSNFVACDWGCDSKALWDVKFSQIEGYDRKFCHIELSNTASSVKFSNSLPNTNPREVDSTKC